MTIWVSGSGAASDGLTRNAYGDALDGYTLQLVDEGKILRVADPGLDESPEEEPLIATVTIPADEEVEFAEGARVGVMYAAGTHDGRVEIKPAEGVSLFAPTALGDAPEAIQAVDFQASRAFVFLVKAAEDEWLVEQGTGYFTS